MRYMRSVFFVLVITLLLTGCKSLAPFTNELRVDNQWSKGDLKNIQFYTSNKIVLNRQLKSNETEIVSGKIKMVDGKRVEQVIIKKGTPGVAVAFPDAERIAVSFEISDQYYLTFGVNPKRGKRFYLLGKDWKGKIGKVTYDDRVFLTSPESSDVFLAIDLKRINKEDYKVRTAKGRKL